jgi:hypothetical protein
MYGMYRHHIQDYIKYTIPEEEDYKELWVMLSNLINENILTLGIHEDEIYDLAYLTNEMYLMELSNSLRDKSIEVSPKFINYLTDIYKFILGRFNNLYPAKWVGVKSAALLNDDITEHGLVFDANKYAFKLAIYGDGKWLRKSH